MATVVNNPSASQSDTSWVGTIIGVLVVGFLLILFFFYGLPLLRNAGSGGGGSQINVRLPDKVNVNPSPQTPSNQ